LARSRSIWGFSRSHNISYGLYSCIGFGAGFLVTLHFGVTLDQFGGISQLGAWELSFGTCGLAETTLSGARLSPQPDISIRDGSAAYRYFPQST
jgi:hypothetical protein